MSEVSKVLWPHTLITAGTIIKKEKKNTKCILRCELIHIWLIFMYMHTFINTYLHNISGFGVHLRLLLFEFVKAMRVNLLPFE